MTIIETHLNRSSTLVAISLTIGRISMCFYNGSPAWDRTTDTLINSQVQLPLCYWGIKNLARVLGLEPRITESKSVVLPLHYTRTEILGGDKWYRSTLHAL